MAIVAIDPRRPDRAALDRAAAILRRGGLVAFPTETVYGLGANALSESAVRRIYKAKGRPAHNPLIVHVADAEAARSLVAAWPPAAARLADAFWPGPLTLVLPRATAVPDLVTAGLDTVAVRVPSHPVALGLLRAAGLPLAAPSANPSSRISPTTAGHVAGALGDRVDLILDAGPTSVGIESAVVDLSGPAPALLRPGTISATELERVIGERVLIGPAAAAAPGGTPRSPGQLERHYAPRATIVLFGPAGREEATSLVERETAAGRRVGALLRNELSAPLHQRRIMPRSPDAYARQLYAALHAADAAGCDLLLIERVPETAAWAGVRDRLERAATAAP